MTASTPLVPDLNDWARIYPEALDTVGMVADVAAGPNGIVMTGIVEVRRAMYAWAAWASQDGLTWHRALLGPPGPAAPASSARSWPRPTGT